MKIKIILTYSLILTLLGTGLFFWLQKMAHNKAEFEQETTQLLSKLDFVQSKESPLQALEKKHKYQKKLQAIWELAKKINAKHYLYEKWLEHKKSTANFPEMLQILEEYADFCLRKIAETDKASDSYWKISAQLIKELKSDYSLENASGDWQAEGDFKWSFLNKKLEHIRDQSLEFLLTTVSYKTLCCMGNRGIEILGQHQAYKKNELIQFLIFNYDHCDFPYPQELNYSFDSHYGYRNSPTHKFYPQKRGLDSVRVNIRQYDAFGHLERGHSDYIKYWVY